MVHDIPPFLSHTAPTSQTNCPVPKQPFLDSDHTVTFLAQLDFYIVQAVLNDEYLYHNLRNKIPKINKLITNVNYTNVNVEREDLEVLVEKDRVIYSTSGSTWRLVRE